MNGPHTAGRTCCLACGLAMIRASLSPPLRARCHWCSGWHSRRQSAAKLSSPTDQPKTMSDGCPIASSKPSPANLAEHSSRGRKSTANCSKMSKARCGLAACWNRPVNTALCRARCAWWSPSIRPPARTAMNAGSSWPPWAMTALPACSPIVRSAALHPPNGRSGSLLRRTNGMLTGWWPKPTRAARWSKACCAPPIRPCRSSWCTRPAARLPAPSRSLRFMPPGACAMSGCSPGLKTSCAVCWWAALMLAPVAALTAPMRLFGR